MKIIQIRDNITDEVVHTIEIHGESSVDRVLEGLANKIDWDRYYFTEKESGDVPNAGVGSDVDVPIVRANERAAPRVMRRGIRNPINRGESK